ncbi:hypothetical protein GCM10009799_20550 [Nocardiopsis rhodophaea]|uniref:Uncharacterized protein n=1 Tax=Nocardiopsis rhodophaea TaxID=280238 RepID=A0ABN2SZK0_9ACTN
MSDDVYVYRNRNTGDEVRRAGRSVRLDHLPNWEVTDVIGQTPRRRAKKTAHDDTDEGGGE